MKAFILFMAGFSCYTSAYAQSAELLAGNRYTYYQHSISRDLSRSSPFLGVTHIASTIMRYAPVSETRSLSGELMNQLYLRVKLNSHVSILGGAFFSNAAGLRPAAAASFTLRKRDLFILIQPRIDIWKTPSYELFGIAEYQPYISDKLNGYARVQFMTNHGSLGHNRSYQQFRIGVRVAGLQAGLGLQCDQYGRAGKMYVNTGVFLRKNLF